MTIEAFELYHKGYISDALKLLEGSSDPAAKALVALTRNRPGEVLQEPMPTECAALEYRAVAAWRTGDRADLILAVERLLASSYEVEGIQDLAMFSSLAQAARGDRMRTTILDVPASAPFDPELSHVIVDVEVNGEVVRFCYDTGAEMTVVNASIAKRLGIKRVNHAAASVGTNAGEIDMCGGLISRLRFLGLAWADVPVLVTDLSTLKARLNIDGVLGVQDLLSDCVLRVDYPRGEITRRELSSGEGWPIHFTQGRSLISLEGRMEGGPQGSFRIDTGGGRSVLTKEYLAAALERGADWEISTPLSVVRKEVTESIRERSELSHLRFHPLEGSASLDLSRIPVDTTAADSLIVYAGKLGATAFKGRVLELDYPACRMRLTPCND